MRKAVAVVASSLIAAVAFPASHVMASFVPPASLPDGATSYQILFVTSASISPELRGIAAYNTFATSQANASGGFLPSGLTWNAVVSSDLYLSGSNIIPPVSAAANAPSSAGIPVYNTQGQLITNLGLYSGNLVSALPEYNQEGVLDQTIVATGTDQFGDVGQYPLGQGAGWNFGADYLGTATQSNGYWLFVDVQGTFNPMYPIYALSNPIPLSSPEPASLSLLASGFLAFGGFQFSRR
ncbi:MAG TPA: hypothetical protein VGP63_12885, partial [Planctomycetaceae bacterium]|nr:hypothetical protein [Planctomycetaceae bacterium]